MPNIKSAIKRVKITQKKQAANRSVKSRISTEIKKFKAYLTTDVSLAEAQLKVVFSVLDNAAQDNVIHANNAARKKAHFAHLLAIASQPQA